MPGRIEVDPARRRGHRTIASAVAAAAPGDEIHVVPGTYGEPVVLHRPVHLTATPGTVTIEARNTFSLHVLPAAAGSTVAGLHLRGQDSHATVKVEARSSRLVRCVIEAVKVEGLWATGPGEIDMEDCRVTSALNIAVNVRDGAVGVLRSCTLSAPGSVGMEAADAQIALDGCAFVDIARNALNLASGVRGVVARCAFRDGRSPDYPSIFVGAQGDVTIDTCAFERLRAEAVMYTAGARGRVEHCTFSSLEGNGMRVAGGASVAIHDLTATDVDKTLVHVEGGGRVEIVGARVSGRFATALILDKDTQGDVTDLVVTGGMQAVIAVLGATLSLSRATFRDARTNVLAISDAGTCRATALLIESGEVDFPLMNVWAGSTLTMTSSTIRGGAVAAVHSAGNLELAEVAFEGVGGPAVCAIGSMAGVDGCTMTDVGVGVEAASGCRVSVTGAQIDGAGQGIVARSKAIVRVTDTTVRRSRASGVVVEGAKVVLRSSRIEGSGGDGVTVHDESEIELRTVAIGGSAGVGVRSTTPLALDGGAVEFHDNAKGDVAWPGRSARSADRTVEEVMAELDLLVGLANVKKKIRSLVNIIALRRREADLGRTSEPVTLHAVFTGPPGTGKTTVARLYGELLHVMGFLDSGRFYEVTRADLVVGFIGQTATNTRHKFTEAMGGVLFIDEAYSLAQTGGAYTDFGEEAINELVPLMENHRRDVAVIAAGYTDRMVAFLDTNPGLKSRFAATIEFPSYSDDELMEIFRRSLIRQERTASSEALAAAAAHFASLPRDSDFANGRESRRLLDAVVEAIANRVAESGDFSEDALSTVIEADVCVAVGELSGRG